MVDVGFYKAIIYKISKDVIPNYFRDLCRVHK